MSITTTELDQEMLQGDHGPGVATAMRILVAVARSMGAHELLDISGAHIDGCLYQGRVGLDFVNRLHQGGARVRVPTTTNVSSLDLLHPDLYNGSAEVGLAARRLMKAYEGLGCRATWTCAPYQLSARPQYGEQLAWAESNAIVFANSVLGARTHRYGDFLDICAAVTGRAPAAGLHLTENRYAKVVVDVGGLSGRLRANDVFFPVLGHFLGLVCGREIPVITGLDAATEDQMKAMGAAGAAAGSLAMFHIVGVTPDAPDLVAALGNKSPNRVVAVGPDEIQSSRDSLSTFGGGRLGAVSIGTPHASLAEIETFVALLGGRMVHPDIAAYLSTGRDVAAAADDAGLVVRLADSGVQVVTDTCTYVTPVIRGTGPVMTNSAKWAYYAPANLGVPVVFGSTAEVVESAVAGKVVRDPKLWSGR